MLISFGHLTKKSLLFLVVPLIVFLRRFIFDKIKLKESNNIFYDGFILFSGRSINGILWIIVNRRTLSNKKEKSDNKETESTTHDQNSLAQNDPDTQYEEELKKCNTYNQYELEYNKKLEKTNSKKIFLLIIVCFLDFLSVTCITIITKIKLFEKLTGGVIYFIIAARLFLIAFLSHLIIKNIKMYRHNYLSIIIILIVVIFINIYSFTVENNKNYLLKLGLMILPELLFSITYVFGAKYLSITEGNIFKLLFIDGIIGIFLLIILQIITYYTVPCDKIKNSHFFKKDASFCDGQNLKTMLIMFNFNNFNFPNFVFSILLILTNFFETWFIWELIFSFSVNHFGAIYAIPLYFYFINNKIDEQTKYQIVLTLGGLTIIFMTFVYNEIIILRFGRFDKNTAKEISMRSIRELSCDFGEDKDEIYVDSNENYLICREDIGEINYENEETL